jgi:hypothetical protein
VLSYGREWSCVSVNSSLLQGHVINWCFIDASACDIDIDQIDAPNPLPTSRLPTHILCQHGMAVRAVGLEVKDATAAFDTSVAMVPPVC